MAKTHGKDTRVLVAHNNLSNHFRQAGGNADYGLSPVTAFRDAGTKTIPGLRRGGVSVSGFFDGAADAVDEELALTLGSASGQPVTIALEAGSLVVGKRVAMLLARTATYSVDAPVSDAVATEAEFMADGGGVHTGVALHDFSNETTSGSSTEIHDNLASSSGGAVAHLHVLAASGTTPTLVIKVQHSVDNSVWVDLITFAQASAVTSERKEVTGTVNRYLRETRTIAGESALFAPVIAIARKAG